MTIILRYLDKFIDASIIKSMEERKEKIIKMRHVGMTFKEIGEVLGISKQRVYQILTNKNKELFCAICGKKLKKSDGRKYCLDCQIKGLKK